MSISTSDTIPKRYFSLKEAAQEIGVTTACLRDRGKTFNLIAFNRNPGNKIRLTRTDVDKLKLIHNLINNLRFENVEN